jgi:DNA topoisomerase-2
MIFLRCDIENPTFDSQTKDFMSTSPSKFGSTCTVSDKFIEKVAALGVMDTACSITEIKENKQMKKTDGSKTKNIRGIAKLIDANLAGTEKSHLCSLVITEGDSAKAGVVSGLSSEDKNIIGIFPLKGKVMNVRGEDPKRIGDNKEISEFKKILGLEYGKTYTAEDVQKHLRYGKIWILCDQDTDGSHIKGLCINLFHTLWPSLTKIPHFINFMNTPIIKAIKGANKVSFYNENEFLEWKQTQTSTGWKIKYYKGLGTSDREEFKEYLKNRKLVGFEHSEICDETIDMVFNKKKADERKLWLADYDRKSRLDTNEDHVTYTDFIHKEFKHFSNADNDRSIPSMVDGLKESQRKVLFGAFKRNLLQEIKVSQISGYISEHSCYHHGEMSLNQTIVGMAQDFVGSNNINLLMPNGQFGTRLRGGKDSASPRYIFTALSHLTRILFPQEDDNVLNYLEDDGTIIEPSFYVPIIPMILVNGAKGIGTGYSTDIPCYNPRDIISYIKEKLIFPDHDSEFIPFYRGFSGTIEKFEKRFLVKGKYRVLGKDKIEILELPVGTWTDDYKEFLESLTDTTDKNGNKVTPIVKDYDDLCKDTTISFVVKLHKGALESLQDIEKTFKLTSTISISNMHLFDENGKLVKYSRVNEIIDDFMRVRHKTYQERKEFIIKKIETQILFLENRVNYLNEVIIGTIDLRKKGSDVKKMLEEKGYLKLGESADYKYLTQMYMDSINEENVEKKRIELQQKKDYLELVKNTTIEETWMRELTNLEMSLGSKKQKLIIV